ncbi:hypothetical protein BT96DRAFT_755232, partial [Gymnopus androsaceus JB14]
APSNNIGLEELIVELKDIEENGEKERDDVEGFVEVLQEMSEEEREQWEKDVKPVRTALFKARKISFKIINSTTVLLPQWREHVANTAFKDRVLPCNVATWWNSTYNMLAAFLEMKEPVSQF